jgi:thioredoxin 1
LIVNATVDNFDTEVRESEGPVVVQFHATWCGPCKALAPHFEAASERAGNIKWVRADIDELDRSTLDEYSIMSVPTVLMFENGKPVKPVRSRTVYGILEEVNG